MIQTDKFVNMTFKEILGLNLTYKMRAIEMLIIDIAEDEAYMVLTELKTKEEQEDYLRYIKNKIRRRS